MGGVAPSKQIGYNSRQNGRGGRAYERFHQCCGSPQTVQRSCGCVPASDSGPGAAGAVWPGGRSLLSCLRPGPVAAGWGLSHPLVCGILQRHLHQGQSGPIGVVLGVVLGGCRLSLFPAAGIFQPDAGLRQGIGHQPGPPVYRSDHSDAAAFCRGGRSGQRGRGWVCQPVRRCPLRPV